MYICDTLDVSMADQRANLSRKDQLKVSGAITKLEILENQNMGVFCQRELSTERDLNSPLVETTERVLSLNAPGSDLTRQSLVTEVSRANILKLEHHALTSGHTVQNRMSKKLRRGI